MMAMELKYALLARSKKLIGSTTPSSRAICAKCRMARFSSTRWRDAQVARVLLDAEVRRLEQLLDQDDLRARFAASRTARSALAMFAVEVPAAGELRGRDGDLALVRFRCAG